MDQYPEITIEHDTHQFETVAGYILHHTGRIPKVNEKLRNDGNTFIISKATQSRLENVKLIINSTNKIIYQARMINHYPQWARELAKKYLRRSLNQIIIHVNNYAPVSVTRDQETSY